MRDGIPIQTRVPEDVAEALKRRAQREERSVASVVRLILKDAVEPVTERRAA